LDRSQKLDPLLSDVIIAFECTDDCKTIIDEDHINEMNRFAAYVVDDVIWPQVCFRDLRGDNKEYSVDGS